MNVLTNTYQSKNQGQSLLYNIVNNNLESFLDMAQADPGVKELPSYVEKEFRAYLNCGIFAHGFCLVRCLGDDKTPSCKTDLAVPFSCKFRGFCPSCATRRMHSKSIYLSEHIIPRVNIRQWVLSVPFELRYWMASDDTILKKINQIAIDEISKYIQEKLALKNYPEIKCGHISFFQRSSSDLALNYHFHILALDGAYSWNKDPRIKPKFHKIKQPTDQEIENVVTKISEKALKYLIKIGKLTINSEEQDINEESEESDVFGKIKTAAIRRRIAFGKRSGQKVRQIGKSFGFFEEKAVTTGKRTAKINGFSLHANRRVKAKNREELEFLIRYVSRGEISEEKLSLEEDGEVILELGREFADGTTAIKLTQLELLEKITAIIPHPYKNLIVYSGCFAPNCKMRPLIILDQKSLLVEEKEKIPTNYIPWAELLRKVHGQDLFKCPYCGGERKIIAVITKSEIIRAILLNLNLPPDHPKTAPSTFNQFDEYFE